MPDETPDSRALGQRRSRAITLSFLLLAELFALVLVLWMLIGDN